MTVIAALCVTSCDWFVLDNMPGHDATVTGKIVDADGNLVPSEVYSYTQNYSTYNNGYINIVELGWDEEAYQTWFVKNNGTYRNNLVWAGKYRMDTKDANFYPVTHEFELKKGDNEVNFTVQPYVKFLSQEFTYDATTKKIIGTCQVQVTDPTKTTSLNEVRLCCYTDCFVSTYFNNCSNDAGAVKQNVAFDADGKATVTVEIDTQLEANFTEFKYERVHYVRFAALATGSANSSARYNFTQTYSLKLDGSEAVEYNKW